jgi:hypothetical protein
LDYALHFVEAAASLMDPVNLLGFLLAGVLIRAAWLALAAGVGWAEGLWLIVRALAGEGGWHGDAIAAALLGTAAGSAALTWVAWEIAQVARRLRARGTPDARP